MERSKSYCGEIVREVDMLAKRVAVCPTSVLIKAHYKCQCCMSFSIWELNDERQTRSPRLRLTISTAGLRMLSRGLQGDREPFTLQVGW